MFNEKLFLELMFRFIDKYDKLIDNGFRSDLDPFETLSSLYFIIEDLKEVNYYSVINKRFPQYAEPINVIWEFMESYYETIDKLTKLSEID